VQRRARARRGSSISLWRGSSSALQPSCIRYSVLGLLSRSNILILKKASSLSLAQFESPSVTDQLQRARTEASARPLSLLVQHLNLLRSFVTVAAYVALLMRLNIWIDVPPLLSSVSV
jgi:hypothetical protein